MRVLTLAFASCILAVFLALVVVPAHAQKKDYLSQTEADEIRDAETPSDRIKLLISFASDRIKKLQYELAHPGDSLHRADRLNTLINAYTGCVDDAAESIDLGVDKQQDVREGIKDMQSHAPGFLDYLKNLEAKGPELDSYKDNLDDAVDATNDAIRDADEAAKEDAPSARATQALIPNTREILSDKISKMKMIPKDSIGSGSLECHA